MATTNQKNRVAIALLLVQTDIALPAPPLKRDNRYQWDKKRKRCQRRAAIEAVIGHLKSDYRLGRLPPKPLWQDTWKTTDVLSIVHLVSFFYLM